MQNLSERETRPRRMPLTHRHHNRHHHSQKIPNRKGSRPLAEVQKVMCGGFVHFLFRRQALHFRHFSTFGRPRFMPHENRPPFSHQRNKRPQYFEPDRCFARTSLVWVISPVVELSYIETPDSLRITSDLVPFRQLVAGAIY